jgi:hypothetical protein
MTRQEFMLAVLAAGNGEEYGPVQVQKLFFLIDRTVPERVGGPWFDFQPDAYGPFDQAVYQELRTLAAQGLVAISSPPNGPPSYRPTPKGLAAGQGFLASFPAAMADYLRQLSAWVHQQSFESLVGYIYQTFPEMKVRAVFAGKP